MPDELIAVKGTVTVEAKGADGVKQTDDALKGLKKTGDGVKESVGGMKVAMTNASVVIKDMKEGVGLLKDSFIGTIQTIMKLGEEGAQITQLHESFQRVIGSGGEAAEMERNIAEATNYAVDGEAAQSAVLQMLAGSTGVFADKVKAAVPQLFQMAAASSKLNPMLGDTTQVIQGMATALETGNLRSLKRMGIMVDAKASEEAYAKSIGKTREELTEEEQKVAYLNAALAYLPTLMAQAGGNTESATDSFGRMKVALDDVADAFKETLAPGAAKAADALALLLTWQNRVRAALESHGEEVFKTTETYDDYITEMKRAVTVSGQYLDAQGRIITGHKGEQGAKIALTRAEWDLEQTKQASIKAGKDATAVAREETLATQRGTEARERSADVLKKEAEEAKKLADAQATIADTWLSSVTRIKEGNDRYSADRAALTEQLATAHGTEKAQIQEKITLLDSERLSALNAQAAELITPDMFANVASYTEAKRQFMLATGQATKASFAEQDAQVLLATLYGQGKISAEQYTAAILNIPSAVKDGTVSIGELVPIAAGSKVALQNLDKDAVGPVKESFGSLTSMVRDNVRTAFKDTNDTLGGPGGTISDLTTLNGMAQHSAESMGDPLEKTAYQIRGAFAEADNAVGGVAGNLADIKKMNNLHIDIYVTTHEKTVQEPGTTAPVSGGGGGTDTEEGGGGPKGKAEGGWVGAGIYQMHPNEYVLSEAMRSGRAEIAPGALAPAAIARLPRIQGGTQIKIYGGLALYGVQDTQSLLEQLQELSA